MQAEFNVTGLRELRSALNKLDKSIAGELRTGLKEAAGVVARDAARAVPRRTGRAAASVRPVSRGNTIFVQGGGARVPYYGWLEFGGRVGRNRSVSRPKVRNGRYIRPAVARNEREIVEKAADAFRSAARKAGLA